MCEDLDKPIHLHQELHWDAHGRGIDMEPQYVLSFESMTEVVEWTIDDINYANEEVPDENAPYEEFKKNVDFIAWDHHHGKNTIFKIPKNLYKWGDFEEDCNGYTFVPLFMTKCGTMCYLKDTIVEVRGY
jgi:hypothetical protein